MRIEDAKDSAYETGDQIGAVVVTANDVTGTELVRLVDTFFGCAADANEQGVELVAVVTNGCGREDAYDVATGKLVSTYYHQGDDEDDEVLWLDFLVDRVAATRRRLVSAEVRVSYR